MAAAPPLATLIATPEDGPLGAAGLVTAILKHCAAKSLEELYAAVRESEPKTITKLGSLVVTEAQLELIESYGDIVSLLRISPTTNISLCSDCGKTTVVEGTPPAKCALTLGCPGTPTKSTFAKKSPVVSEASENTE